MTLVHPLDAEDAPVVAAMREAIGAFLADRLSAAGADGGS